MELNIINYILDSQRINQNDLAKKLDPPVTKSTLSRWKNSKEPIPKDRIKELYRIARVGEFEYGHKSKWKSLTSNSKMTADQWYWSFAEYLPNDEYSIWVDNKPHTKINYESVWIDNIQRILITLSNAGVNVNELDFTFDPAREIDESADYADFEGFVYTPTDELLIPYIKHYLSLRQWGTWNILSINNKYLGQLQFDLALKASEIALYQIPEERFEALEVNIVELDKFIRNSRAETMQLLSQFINSLDYHSKSFDYDENIQSEFYFRYISENSESLDADVFALPKYIEKHGKQGNKKSDFEISTDEKHQETLDRIENLEKLLIEIKEQLNNITNNGEVNGK